MPKIYVVITKTNTVVSKAIRFCTKKEYNHVSLSFDPSLEQMYSFGRIYPNYPVPGGFVREGKSTGFFKRFSETECLVFEKNVSRESERRFFMMLRFFQTNRYKFNQLGLFTLLAGVPLERRRAFFCSQFCGKMLSEIGACDLPKQYGLLQPMDFSTLEGFSLVYEGKLKDYQPVLQQAAG